MTPVAAPMRSSRRLKAGMVTSLEVGLVVLKSFIPGPDTDLGFPPESGSSQDAFECCRSWVSRRKNQRCHNRLKIQTRQNCLGWAPPRSRPELLERRTRPVTYRFGTGAPQLRQATALRWTG